MRVKLGSKKPIKQKPAVKAKTKSRNRSTAESQVRLTDTEEFLLGRSSSLRSVIGAERKRWGDATMSTVRESAGLCIGIEMPFPMQYLLQCDALPLGCTMQVVGKHASNKSSLTFEIARWFKDQYGIAYLVENESKYSPDFARSIIGYEDERYGAHLAHEDDDVLYKIDSSSCDDWQSKLQSIVADWKKEWGVKIVRKAKKGAKAVAEEEEEEEIDGDAVKKPRGRKNKGPVKAPNFPILLILDSIMGKLAQETQDKMTAAGHAERTFAEEARQITNFLKKFPEDIAKWPFMFVAVNQLKLSKEPGQQVATRRKAGGDQINFVESFELQMEKVGQYRYIEKGDDYGLERKVRKIKLKVFKNSMGEDDRSIEAPLVWRYRWHAPSNSMRQYTYWDWAAATTQLLTKFDEAGRKNRIQEIVDLRPVSGGRFYSKVLKVRKEDALDAHDIGKKLLANKDVVRKLQKLFAIKRVRKFAPGTDYREQRAEAKKLIYKATND